jgi:hypothetical protein
MSGAVICELFPPGGSFQGQWKEHFMRRILTTALATAAIGIATPAAATVTLGVPDPGSPLDLMIHASKTDTQNSQTVVYGSTAQGGQSADVTFTANTAVNITDNGGGYASVSDVLSDNTLFTSLTIDPDLIFTDMKFTLQLNNIDAGSLVSVYYTLVGGGEQLLGTYTDNGNNAVKYFVDGDLTDQIDKIRVTVAGGSIFEFKQDSINAAPGAVPEPGTWGLMLLGFAGIGMAVRRSRKRNPALLQIA